MVSFFPLFSPSIITLNVYLNISFKSDRPLFTSYPSLKEEDLSFFYKEESAIEVTTYGADRPKYSQVLCFFEHHTIDDRLYVDPKDIKVLVEKEVPFYLPEHQFNDLFERAKAAFAAEGRRPPTKENRALIRINRIMRDKNQMTILIQPNDYNTQVATNLVMDMKHWDGKTWRQKLQEQYGFRLPPLGEAPLADSLGVSLILVTKNGQAVLPLRSSLAVWGDQWGCTSSFAAGWKQEFREMNFKEFLDKIVPPHLLLEIGTTEIEFTPLALCREWLRGGKPQLLLVGLCDLTLDQLNSYIDRAPHRDEIKKKWTGRVLMTERNAKQHVLSQELKVNTEYMRRFLQTSNGKDFFGTSRLLPGV